MTSGIKLDSAIREFNFFQVCHTITVAFAQTNTIQGCFIEPDHAAIEDPQAFPFSILNHIRADDFLLPHDLRRDGQPGGSFSQRNYYVGSSFSLRYARCSLNAL